MRHECLQSFFNGSVGFVGLMIRHFFQGLPYSAKLLMHYFNHLII